MELFACLASLVSCSLGPKAFVSFLTPSPGCRSCGRAPRTRVSGGGLEHINGMQEASLVFVVLLVEFEEAHKLETGSRLDP
jgi:hypothetical protein